MLQSVVEGEGCEVGTESSAMVSVEMELEPDAM